MSSYRTTHFSRLLDIVSGSAFAATKLDIQGKSVYKDFDASKLEDKRFRELLTANLPAFYIVDCNLIADEIIKVLNEKANKYISSIPSSEGALGFGEPGFSESISRITEFENPTKSSKFKTELVRILYVNLAYNLKLKPFLPIYNDIEKLYVSMQQDFNNAKTYLSFRNAAARYGNKIRSLLQSQKTFIASDASYMVSLKSDSLLIIGPTFDIIRKEINPILTETAQKYIESFGVNLNTSNQGFKIGNIVNAGHTVAYSSSGEIIGINMPYGQETQFLLDKNPKAFEVDTVLGSIDIHVEYGIKFTQNFTEQAKNLLNMQFAFVVSMPAELNTGKLKDMEVARIKQLVKGELLPTLAQQVKNKLASGAIRPQEYGASPSLIDHITLSLVNAISGKPPPSTVKTSKVTANTTFSVPVQKISPNVSKIKAKTSGNSFKLNVPVASAKNVAGKAISLARLQVIINNAIGERIADNMGTGTRADVLNFQSGRFASTVEVERMSVSREGMITAFYRYMKYPYATFEPGGRQGLPKSRDPKLLISKSIREIASSIVGNRMRAVSI